MEVSDTIISISDVLILREVMSTIYDIDIFCRIQLYKYIYYGVI